MEHQCRFVGRVNTGQFEVYDIANNQLTGAAPLGTVGLDWLLGGFAVDPPSSDGSTSQRPPRCRHVIAVVADSPAARLRVAREAAAMAILLANFWVRSYN